MSRYPSVAFEHYWSMWNEPDPDLVRAHLERAVSDDIEFCDPINHHVGKDALEQNVHAFRAEQPDAVFVLGSGIDSHHDRHRYEWHFTRRGRVLLRGYDVATTAAAGLLCKVDGFFGPLPALDAET